MITAAPLIIRIPQDLGDSYSSEPEWQRIVLQDLAGYFLQFWIDPENYNAANPVVYDTKIGYSQSYTTVTKSLYKFEATDLDARSHLKYRVLKDLLEYPGTNLDFYGLSQSPQNCEPPLVVVEDYHVLDSQEDVWAGYTKRVGILQCDPLRGAYRDCNSVCAGNSYVITPIEDSRTSGSVMNDSEWTGYRVLSRFAYGIPVDYEWEPSQVYTRGDRIAAIAPRGYQTNVFSKGLKLIFTQTA